ncbi:hypothetical protein [Chroococcus sp. FPU101]|uniref:hypothetical protein n=1 Tax=Chroococcus sp. FPU101 TaxID=1974212 RepID=UPI001A9024A2|nr:hypothetical protein [Chroococcus sp. FPU101]GFE68012.1 hypothetical protein CFPU101_06220 [Chroococcus sp. FPU101]
MDAHYLGIAAVSSLLLVISSLSTVQPSPANFLTVQVQQQKQVTTYQIDAATLKRPCWLSVRASNFTSIQGRITLNRRVIHSLKNTNTRLDLARYLRVGKNTIAITGNYYPVDDSVMIEFDSQDIRLQQQTGGNGRLNQILILEVK